MAYRKILVYRCKEYINGRRAGALLLPFCYVHNISINFSLATKMLTDFFSSL